MTDQEQADQEKGPREAPDSYADPQDTAFGKSVSEKEEQLDEALREGRGTPSEGESDDPPRPAGKAEPDAPGSR